MMNKAQGFGLSLITKIAGSEVLDQLKLRKFVEKSLYQGSKTGFKVLNKTQKMFKPQPLDKQRLPNQVNKNLFDLSLTEEQQMTVDAMSQFAEEVLYALAHEADHQAQFPEQLWQHLVDQAHETAINVLRPISHKYDKAEHAYPKELNMLAALLDGMNESGEGVGAANASKRGKANPDAIVNGGNMSAAIHTTATKDGDDYILNGKKIFVTSGERADSVVVWASLDKKRNPNFESHAHNTASHMLWVSRWWYCYRDAIRLLNPKMAGEIHDHFMDGSFSAGLTLGADRSKELDERIQRDYPYQLGQHDLIDFFRQR